MIYTGTDPIGPQLSTVFTGSDKMQKLINTNNVLVKGYLDKITTAVK